MIAQAATPAISADTTVSLPSLSFAAALLPISCSMLCSTQPQRQSDGALSPPADHGSSQWALLFQSLHRLSDRLLSVSCAEPGVAVCIEVRRSQRDLAKDCRLELLVRRLLVAALGEADAQSVRIRWRPAQTTIRVTDLHTAQLPWACCRPRVKETKTVQGKDSK